MTITEFLTARYDEDEAVAQRAHDDPYPTQRMWNGSGQYPVVAKRYLLADIAAKRAIVEAHPWEYADPYESWKDDAYRERYGDTRGNRNCKTCGGTASHPNFPAGVERRDSWPCMTLRLLAQPYAEHPDFDQRWRV